MAELTPCYLIKLEARFLQHCEVMPDGCRVWRGAQSRGGQRPYSGPYGSFYIDKEHNAVRAHVFAAFLAGKIPSLRVPLGTTSTTIATTAPCAWTAPSSSPSRSTWRGAQRRGGLRK